MRLFAPVSLLAGCGGRSDCSESPSNAFQNHGAFEITAEELEAVLDEDGELTDEGCESLCRSHSFYESDSVTIEDCHLVDYETTDTDAAVSKVSCGWSGYDCT